MATTQRERTNLPVLSRPERTGRRRAHLSPIMVLAIAATTAVALQTVFNGVEFGHWDPLYAPPVISK